MRSTTFIISCHSKTVVGSVDQYLAKLDRLLQELKGYLLRAQQLMKDQANLHRREVHFDVGD